jgi:hypothetical protein
MTELETTIEYYKELLLYQYINQPKARATVGLLVSQALVDLLPKYLRESFDIETATGPQLDILGEYVGFNRVVKSLIPRRYFKLDDYESPLGNPAGFSDYTDRTINADGSMYDYFIARTSTYTLDDSEYRILLKLKICLNTSENTLYAINQLLYDFFGTDIILGDQRDMSFSYLINGTIARIIEIALNEGLLPKPMGVLISGVVSLTDPAKAWRLSDYTFDYQTTVGFSDYGAALPDSEMVDYVNRI